MKKMLFIFGSVILLFIMAAPQTDVWSRRPDTSGSTIHYVMHGEYLSKISLKYYGTPKYWQELALLNRSSSTGKVLPGDEIIIPEKTEIERIYRSTYSGRR